MKATARYLLLILICFLAACSKKGGSPTSLDDSEAKKILLQVWNQPYIGFPLGNVEVSHGLSGKRDPAKRLFNQEDLNSFRIWMDVGIISMSIQRDLTQEKFTWDNWSKLTQGGVAQEVSISLTELGREINESVDPDFLRFAEAKFTINDITSKEFKELGFDKYCYITGVHQAEYIPAVKEAIERMSSQKIEKERKFRAIFKFDPIESTWTMAAFDITTSRDAQFSTNNVQAALERR